MYVCMYVCICAYNTYRHAHTQTHDDLLYECFGAVDMIGWLAKKALDDIIPALVLNNQRHIATLSFLLMPA